MQNNGDNYEALELIYACKTGETIILKVKEKQKHVCKNETKVLD